VPFLIDAEQEAQFLSTVTSTGVAKSTGYAGKNLRIYKANYDPGTIDVMPGSQISTSRRHRSA